MSDVGLFGPDSVTWRVNREGVLLVGGGTALILQLAHPLVAAGVQQHSNYREDPWGRLYRTLDLTTKIVFGSTATAEEASARIRHTHGRVRGTSDESAGAFRAGTPYDARTHDLIMWVHATLVHTSLLVYQRYVKPLTIAEQRAYYEEQKLLGEMFGVPREHQPETFADFNDYFEGMLASDRIVASDALRDVVDAVMNPELPFVARPVIEALNLATVGHLPASLRDELGLPWGPNRRRLLEASRFVLGAALPVLPKLLREFPPARSADRRARRLAAA
ncbi:MAG: DUF2236 domain-containing protein [Actinomycetota bacterium]|nr:DUF2236 domain-containing protein [Actinomycetota bacterium]